MENAIEKLFNIIKENTKQWYEYKELFGDKDPIATVMLNNITRLEKAFERIAGHSYTTHLIEYCRSCLHT